MRFYTILKKFKVKFKVKIRKEIGGTPGTFSSSKGTRGIKI